MLSGGDDYELVFSAASARRDSIARLAGRLRVKLTRIGKVIRRRKGPLVTVLDATGRPFPLGQTGYKHF